jgi:hypothetical protein
MRLARGSLLALLPALVAAGPIPGERATSRWGERGHEMSARAAAATLPEEMPAFFRYATDQLVYLDPEPDRWRDRSRLEMAEAATYDHYIDLENIPPAALEAPDRFSYLATLYEAGLDKPERDGGFLPFRIVELYQRIVTEWRLWERAGLPERLWIEARIINDAGILGHYVTDGSQPHHTTIHFNGWDADAPNPEGFTLDRSFHTRFEGTYVNAFVTPSDVNSRTATAPTSFEGSVRSAVFDYLRTSHRNVETLYRLERDFGFDPGGPFRPSARDFAADRLAAGATMLGSLWWSAWLEGTDSANTPGSP